MLVSIPIFNFQMLLRNSKNDIPKKYPNGVAQTPHDLIG